MKEVLAKIDEVTEDFTADELGFAIKFLTNKIEYLSILKDYKTEEETPAVQDVSNWKNGIINAS